MDAPRKNFSRPSSSAPDPSQDRHAFYPNANAASSQSHLAPPTVPFATRRKRTSSLPGNAQNMHFGSDGSRLSRSSEDRPRHLTAPRSASKLSSQMSREDMMNSSSPSSSTSSAASRSPKWYQRWFGTTPAVQSVPDRSSADSTPRTLSKPRTRRMSVHSVREKYSYSHADAPPLPQNPYWHTKPDGVAINHAAEAESAGDDFAW